MFPTVLGELGRVIQPGEEGGFEARYDGRATQCRFPCRADFSQAAIELYRHCIGFPAPAAVQNLPEPIIRVPRLCATDWASAPDGSVKFPLLMLLGGGATFVVGWF
jgi:hypothetical protein